MKNNTQPWYAQTENLIKLYWRSKERLLRLREKEKILQLSMGELKDRLNTSKEIPVYARKFGVISWSARKGDFDYSSVLVEYEKLVDEISKDLIRKNKALVSIQKRIYELLGFLSPLELVFNRLTGEERKLTEEKYLLNLSNYQIADTLHCSEKRVRTMQKKILRKIADWLGKDDHTDLAI